MKNPLSENHIDPQMIFSAIINSSDDAIISKSLDGIIMSWNKGAEKIFGYHESEVIGRSIKILFPQERLHEEDLIMSQISQGKRIEHIETRRIHKDGHQIEISATISPIIDKQGNILGASKIARDISEKKEIEKTHAHFAAIVNSSDDAIVSKTLDGIITSWNPGAQRVFGYSAEEVIGRPMLLLFPKDKVAEEDEILAKIKKGERIEHFETIRIHKDGHPVNISATISPVYDGQGKIIGASKIARDISERKKIENELIEYREHLEELVATATSEVKAILQTAVNGVVSIDEKGQIHLFNPAAEELFGWKSEEVIGRNVALLMEPSLAQEHDHYIQHYLTTGEKKIIGKGREIIALRKDGTTFPAHLAVGHNQLSGNKHLFVAFIADITLQKKAEQELLQAKNNAEAALKTKASFLANMSHEIRTPMNSIIGFAEIALQEPSLPGHVKEHIKTILNAGNHLLIVINDILDFSKIEAGKIKIEKVCFHLEHALADVIKNLEAKAKEKGVKLILDIAENIPHRVLGDPTRLRQVILNLVGNAIKFSKTGDVIISVVPQEGDMLHFSVKDSGIGMNPEQVKRVFDSFTQADISTSRKYGGTGLGTTISKQIVELMGGSIGVTSVLNQGSDFYFSVELPEAQNTQNCLYETEQTLSEEYISPRKFNILVAEDIEANATLATLRLTKQGHQITWVKNGSEAIDAWQQNDFDIILMDVQMPILDGIQASQNIRAKESFNKEHIAIIALTASVLKEELELCFNAGMDAVVGKPINFKELLVEMEKLVPLERGKVNDLSMLVNKMSCHGIDFSPIEEMIDKKKVLETWREEKVYIQALLDFIETNREAGDRIKALLPQETEQAKVLIHTLKGLAGNLQLTQIFPIVLELEKKIKTEHDEMRNILLDDLNQAISLLASGIKRIKWDSSKPSPPKAQKLPDKKILQTWFNELVESANSLNTEVVGESLSKFEPYFSDEQLEPVRHALDGFDFEKVKLNTKILAAELKIDIVSGRDE